jgi:hypothetical protein
VTADDLAADERELLAQGLSQWGGPASPTEAVVSVMGFADVAEFDSERRRIVSALRGNEALEQRDFLRALLATEIVFISDSLGAGVEWETVTGLSDDDTIHRLRALQRRRFSRDG